MNAWSLRCCVLGLVWTTALAALAAAKATDGTITSDGNRWVLGTASVERVVALEAGKLLLVSLRNKVTGRELAPGAGSEEFRFHLGEGRELVTNATGPWKLVRAAQTRHPQGELQLDLALRRQALLVTKSYVVYPGSSIIREWVTVKNTGAEPLVIGEPGFLDLQVRTGDPSTLDFLWMSGGSNQPASWKLKTETLPPEKPRTFDSYEPFPYEAEEPPRKFPGDGVNAKILLGDRQVWPPSDWQYVANATVQARFDFRVQVSAGDKLVFLVNMNKNIGFDTTAFDPTIAYDGGPAHKASKEFGAEQGQNGWRYQYLQNGRFVDLVYYPEREQWRKQKDNATGTPFVGLDDQHPDFGQDAARVWTASKAGQVRVSGLVSNTGNGGCAGPATFVV